MYIPEFWCGVAVTIIAEIVSAIVYVIHITYKNNGGKEDEQSGTHTGNGE